MERLVKECSTSLPRACLFSCFTNTRWNTAADMRIMILAAFLDSCVLVEKGVEE
jgi:hypothetical protein